MEPGFAKSEWWLQAWAGSSAGLWSLPGTSHPRALFSYLKYMSELSITSGKAFSERQAPGQPALQSKASFPHLLPQEGHDRPCGSQAKQSGPRCRLACGRMQGVMQSFAEERSQRLAGRCSGWTEGACTLHRGRGSGEVSGPWLRLHQTPAPVHPVGPCAVTYVRLTFL